MNSSARAPMIEVDGLTKNYGPYKAVDSLSFTVRKGEVVGFLGPNGAGKTTTMKIITGFMAATSGSVRVGGYDVFENPIEVKRQIGYLPETPPVYGDMSVESYLRFVAKLKGVERARLTELVDRAIQKTDLGSVRKRLIQHLSKGYRQRIGISQALVSDPEILILDEPTVGLDPRQVADVRALIKELAGQHTVLLSTHILPEVQASCERIVIINKGKIVMQDTIGNLGSRLANGGRVFMRVNKAVPSLLQELQSAPGVKSLTQPAGFETFEIETDGSKETAALLASKVVSSGAGLYEMRQESFNLEDVFLKLTTSEESQSRGQA